jgi:hypothetical protein
MLDFAGYYSFVPRVCRPHPAGARGPRRQVLAAGVQTKGKIESTIRLIKGNFWPGIDFDSLSGLNRQSLAWCGEVNGRVHATAREIPQFAHEGLTPLTGQLAGARSSPTMGSPRPSSTGCSPLDDNQHQGRELPAQGQE